MKSNMKREYVSNSSKKPPAVCVKKGKISQKHIADYRYFSKFTRKEALVEAVLYTSAALRDFISTYDISGWFESWLIAVSG